MTEQITRRVRRECQALDKTDQKNVAEKLDSYLTENLRQTHTCPVCFEVMQPPHRSPQMLFPCGHTFCKACVAEHRSRAGAAAKACPVCRSAIESVAENRALRELIETFVGEKRALERGSRAAPELLRTGGGPRDYAEERDAAAVRRDVLAVELVGRPVVRLEHGGTLGSVALFVAKCISICEWCFICSVSCA